MKKKSIVRLTLKKDMLMALNGMKNVWGGDDPKAPPPPKKPEPNDSSSLFFCDCK